MRKILHFLLFISIGLASTQRIMTYNLLNYSGNNAAKEASMRIVISSSNPDIIVAEEVQDQSGFDDFLSDVLNYSTPGLYTDATFTDQNETNVDIALYYKTGRFSFISTSRINTSNLWGRRDVIEFVMLHDASGIEFRVYGCHLKAGTGTDDENERTAEATVLRNYLNELDPETPFIVSGDFNVYDDGEGAFQILIESQDDNDGQCFDPVDRIGFWHNNIAYADVHTQSPRGGNYGGMDDRFDWLFVSQNILADNDINYVDETYTPYGNDGNHFNMAINEGTNYAVSMTIANALENSSDHLPVYMDIYFNDIIESNAKIVITEIMPNPSAVSDSYGEWIELFNNDTIAYNLQNWIIKDMGNDLHTISEEIVMEPGEYLVIGRNIDESSNGGANVDYAATGFILSNTEDEVILMDDIGNRVDEVVYTNAFPFGNGASMHIVDIDSDNALVGNWYVSSIPYGTGDLGTPGYAWDDSLSIMNPVEIPQSFQLGNPYPNPFNPKINIPFDISRDGNYEIQVFDIRGRVVHNFNKNQFYTGRHILIWDADNFASGLYFVRISTAHQTFQKKMLLIK